MYKFDGRIRYSEVDSEGKLSLEALLNYFQDCSTFHSEEIGVGLKYLRDRKKAWLLSAWQIVVDRYPALCDKVTIGTAPYEFKGFMGCRNFLMETRNGERLAYANTVWTLMDMEQMRPARIPKELKDAYILEEKLSMNYASRKITLPQSEGELKENLEVKQHHLDTNQHVNNGQYVRMAMEYLPEGFSIRQMRAEYKQQARLGDIMIPKIYMPKPEVCLIVLNNEEGQPYCIMEFLSRQNRQV